MAVRAWGTGALLAILVAGCRGSDMKRESTTRGGIVVTCSPAPLVSLNPFTASDQLSSDFRLVLYTPLVLYDDRGGFRPYLAKTWEWADSDRTLTLRLRDDVRWHDGQPVSAEDVAWTIRAAAEPRYAYPGGGDFETVEDVQVVDSSAVRIHFRRRFAPGLEPFVALPILPKHLLEDVPPEELAKADYNRAPVGSGPFRFAGRDPDGTLRFARFDDFPAALGRPSLDGLVFRNIVDRATMLVELKTRSVDVCIAGSSIAKDVEADPSLEGLALPPSALVVVPLNTRRAPFVDARVRRALSAALDRAELAAVMSPLAKPATTFLPKGSPAIDPAAGEPDADSALAAALLDSAGWSRDGSGVRSNGRGEPLRFDLVGPQQAEDVLTAVQAQLRRLGFDPQLQLLEAATFFQVIDDPKRRPSAMVLMFLPDHLISPDPTADLRSDGESNLAGYANPGVDSLLDRLRLSADSAERQRIYSDLQRYVAADVPIVYTEYVPRILVVGPRLTGVQTDANGPFATLMDWRIGQ